MHRFKISTESCADIFRSEMEERQISCIIMNYVVENESVGVIYDSEQEYYDFYKNIRAGMLAKTSQINKFEFEAYFRKLLADEERDIIHFSLSSGLSSTADNAKAAAEEINSGSGNPGKVYVVDTLAATQGMAKLVELAADLRDKGQSAADVFMYIERMKHLLHHWIIVSDLAHLRRGGRVSGASAVIGTILNIRPILVINNVGKLAVVNKAVGNNKAINTVLKAVDKYGENLDKQHIYIAQTDNSEFIEQISQALVSEFNCPIKRRFIGPVIGTHTGGGTTGVVFFGKDRLTNPGG